MMPLPALLAHLLVLGVLPAWLLAGFADWLCHRRTRIAHTAGPRESLLHLALYAEIVVPFGPALWLESTAAVLLAMAAGVLAHMLTSWWDTSFAQPRRHIAPIEQLVHSWLEMMPLFALVIFSVLAWPEFVSPRWQFVPREPPLPGPLRTGVLIALGLGVVFILEELLRGLRAALLNARASAPEAGPRR